MGKASITAANNMSKNIMLIGNSSSLADITKIHGDTQEASVMYDGSVVSYTLEEDNFQDKLVVQQN